jgi:acyl-[acyl-carrier-protein] desaturase
MPFPTARSMACYGALQEIATFLIYTECRRKFAPEDNPVLPEIFRLVARDEAAHAVFYRDWIGFELAEDRQGTLSDLAWVLKEFKMPGVTLMPDFSSRLTIPGVAITSQDFLLKGIVPTLKKLGVSRAELFRVREAAARAEATDADAPTRPASAHGEARP